MKYDNQSIVTGLAIIVFILIIFGLISDFIYQWKWHRDNRRDH